MDVTCIIDGLDLHARLSTYQVTQEVNYRRVVTMIDDTEISYPGKKRYIVELSLFPMTDAQVLELYQKLSKMIVSVTFTSPYENQDVVKQMRLTSDLDAVFGLRSINGNRYYKGGAIQLRAV